MEKKVWFKAKKYGWGWYPATWQAWISIALFTCVITLPTIFFEKLIESHLVSYLFFVLLCSTAFIGLCFKKGEKPAWRWGEKNED